METKNAMKALYVIVNAGFADEIVDIMRREGAGGATIINSRGEGAAHKSFMGITVDSEREMVLSLMDGATSERVSEAVKEKAGFKSPAHGICFVVPVEKVIGLDQSTKE